MALNKQIMMYAGDVLEHFTRLLGEYPIATMIIPGLPDAVAEGELMFVLGGMLVDQSAASAAGDYQQGTYRFVFPSATTVRWPSTNGPVAYAITVTDAVGNRKTVEVGSVTVLPDATSSTVVQTTHAERMLAAIQARKEDRATTDQNVMTVNGKSITRMTIGELDRWEGVYQTRVWMERNRRVPTIRTRL
jgi:hypothetical protein